MSRNIAFGPTKPAVRGETPGRKSPPGATVSVASAHTNLLALRRRPGTGRLARRRATHPMHRREAVRQPVPGPRRPDSRPAPGIPANPGRWPASPPLVRPRTLEPPRRWWRPPETSVLHVRIVEYPGRSGMCVPKGRRSGGENRGATNSYIEFPLLKPTAGEK